MSRALRARRVPRAPRTPRRRRLRRIENAKKCVFFDSYLSRSRFRSLSDLGKDLERVDSKAGSRSRRDERAIKSRDIVARVRVLGATLCIFSNSTRKSRIEECRKDAGSRRRRRRTPRRPTPNDSAAHYCVSLSLLKTTVRFKHPIRDVSRVQTHSSACLCRLSRTLSIVHKEHRTLSLTHSHTPNVEFANRGLSKNTAATMSSPRRPSVFSTLKHTSEPEQNLLRGYIYIIRRRRRRRRRADARTGFFN